MRGHLTIAALALVLLTSCATDESSAFLSVVNTTDRVLAVFSFPDGTLIDPVIHLPPGSFSKNMIASGHRLDFDSVPGFVAGKGVTLFVYVVERQGATFTLVTRVSHDQLKLLHGRVTIDALPEPRE